MKTSAALAPNAAGTRARPLTALLFLGVVGFLFLGRTAFFWHGGELLGGTHADESFHYAAERVRMSPDYYAGDFSVQESRSLGEPYASFYRGMAWLSNSFGLTLKQANFVVCWTANVIHLAGVMLLLRGLGLSPWFCALGTVLASQRFALMGQTLITHGLAIPREVWQALLPWFLLWFLQGSREGPRLLWFYGVLGLVYAFSYPLWAVLLGLLFGLVDLYLIVRERNWRNLAWLAGAALICLAVVAAFNLGQFHQFGGEESALFDRTKHEKAIYWTKGFRRFLGFSLLGLWAFWQLGWRDVFQKTPWRRLWLLWVVSVAVACLYQPLETPWRALSMLYLGRATLFNFLVSMVVVALCLPRGFAIWPRWGRWLIGLAAAALCLASLNSAYRGRFDLTLVDLCRWINANTPVSSLLCAPPVEDLQQFRVYAERGLWITPYDKTTLWRTKTLYALMQNRVAKLRAFYTATTPSAERAATLQLLQQDGVDYIVTRADAPWTADLPLPVVHQQGPWQLRKLPDAK